MWRVYGIQTDIVNFCLGRLGVTNYDLNWIINNIRDRAFITISNIPLYKYSTASKYVIAPITVDYYVHIINCNS